MNKLYKVLIILTATIVLTSSCASIKAINHLMGNRYFEDCHGDYLNLIDVNSNLNSLVFIDDWDSAPKILLLDWDTCEETIIEVPSITPEPHVSFGPNGRYIAYSTSFFYDEFGVYDRELERFLVHLEGYDFAISPEGHCVSYWQDLVLKLYCWDTAKETIIYEIPVSTSENIRKSPSHTQWNPDGEYILFELTAYESPQTGSHNIESNIGLINIKSGSYKNLYVGDYIGNIDWSPDGRFILSSIEVKDEEKFVALNPFKDCVVFSIAHPYSTDIYWSPDGNEILFSYVDYQLLDVEEIIGTTYRDLKCPIEQFSAIQNGTI